MQRKKTRRILQRDTHLESVLKARVGHATKSTDAFSTCSVIKFFPTHDFYLPYTYNIIYIFLASSQYFIDVSHIFVQTYLENNIFLLNPIETKHTFMQ